MRPFLFASLALLLAACQTTVPDSGARDIQLEGGVRVPAPILPPEEQVILQVDPTAQTLPQPGSEAEALAAQTRAILGAPGAPDTTLQSPDTRSAALDPQPVGAPAPLPVPAETRNAATGAPPAAGTNSAGISLENDFGAVTAARSIEEDAERLRNLEAQGGVTPVNPNEVVLQRPTSGAPNVVEYALRQARPVGNPGYSRGAFASQRTAERKCQAYRNNDAAQAAFLERGGPQQDQLGLDPDGDGNACGWNPATYRAIVQGQ